MTESRRSTITKVLAIVLALLLVVSVSALSRRTALKATEEGMAEITVEEQADVELYEPEVEVTEEPEIEPEPVIETEIIELEEIEEGAEPEDPEEPVVEEPVEEESVEDEEPVEEEPAEEEPVEEEEEPLDLDVEIWYEFPDGNNGTGSRLVFRSAVKNAPEWMALHYTWQYDRGAGWEDIPGGDGAEYETELTAETGTYQWRLLVTGD